MVLDYEPYNKRKMRGLRDQCMAIRAVFLKHRATAINYTGPRVVHLEFLILVF